MNPFKNHLSSFEDLTTTYNETRSGFISIALEKNRKATPYVKEARILQHRIKNVSKPEDLLKISNIQDGLIAASGISIKASNHLGEEGCKIAIKEFINNFLLPSGDNFKDELIYRFLLTKGDSLGGSMRNVVGALAKRKLNRMIVASLKLSNKDFYWLAKSKKIWVHQTDKFEDIDEAKGLSWHNDEGENRTLYYDITVPLIKNNIDIILLNESKDTYLKDSIINNNNYIALGELKGGIDPAGADEHWKTAKTALDRIIKGFNSINLNPSIFFIGAAIENKMAEEIYSHLEKGYFANAANLTKESHMASITDWLVDL